MGEKGTPLKKHFINNIFLKKDRNLIKKKRQELIKKKVQFYTAKWLKNSQVLQ